MVLQKSFLLFSCSLIMTGSCYAGQAIPWQNEEQKSTFGSNWETHDDNNRPSATTPTEIGQHYANDFKMGVGVKTFESREAALAALSPNSNTLTKEDKAVLRAAVNANNSGNSQGKISFEVDTKNHTASAVFNDGATRVVRAVSSTGQRSEATVMTSHGDRGIVMVYTKESTKDGLAKSMVLKNEGDNNNLVGKGGSNAAALKTMSAADGHVAGMEKSPIVVVTVADAQKGGKPSVALNYRGMQQAKTPLLESGGGGFKMETAGLGTVLREPTQTPQTTKTTQVTTVGLNQLGALTKAIAADNRGNDVIASGGLLGSPSANRVVITAYKQGDNIHIQPANQPIPNGATPVELNKYKEQGVQVQTVQAPVNQGVNKPTTVTPAQPVPLPQQRPPEIPGVAAR